MDTLRLVIDPAHVCDPAAVRAIHRAAAVLRAGGLVAFPTETVYGLGADALNSAAVARIFAAKRRPSWDPVIVHIAGPLTANPMLARLVREIPAPAQRLMEAFWPGPLTLLLPRSEEVPDAVTAGRRLVGVRMPAHPVAFELIRAAGVPVAAPSANLFSHISPTTAAHVLEDLDGRIDAVLDAGPADRGVESTVLDPTRSPMIVYRPGAVTVEQIRALAGPVDLYREQESTVPEAPQALPSPGVGLRHYAPSARLILVDAGVPGLPASLAEIASRFPAGKIGVMLPTQMAASLAGSLPESVEVFDWGNWDQPDELARRLYAGLRWLDGQGCTVILCPLPPEDGVGAAIRDRLRKAARAT